MESSGCHVLNLCVILTGWIFCHKTTIIPCLFAKIFQNKQGAIVGFCYWTFEWVNTNSEWMNIVIHKVYIRYHPSENQQTFGSLLKLHQSLDWLKRGVKSWTFSSLRAFMHLAVFLASALAKCNWITTCSSGELIVLVVPKSMTIIIYICKQNRNRPLFFPDISFSKWS